MQPGEHNTVYLRGVRALLFAKFLLISLNAPCELYVSYQVLTAFPFSERSPHFRDAAPILRASALPLPIGAEIYCRQCGSPKRRSLTTLRHAPSEEIGALQALHTKSLTLGPCPLFFCDTKHIVLQHLMVPVGRPVVIQKSQTLPSADGRNQFPPECYVYEIYID